MKQAEKGKKIAYQRPEVVDLGAVTPFYGGLTCDPLGGTATQTCNSGTTVGKAMPALLPPLP